MKAELRGLPKDLATIVAAHLTVAGQLLDINPQLALAHAQAARRRAARLSVVREATAEAAYAAGEWAIALNEYRAMHRMTGAPEYLPVMADCERAIGRPRDALKLIEQARKAGLDAESQIELDIVHAGARADLGQVDEGIRVLRETIATRRASKLSHARARYALADLLLGTGKTAEARELFAQAASLDAEQELDALDRIAIIEGRTPAPRELPDGEFEVLDYDEEINEDEDFDEDDESEGEDDPRDAADSEDDIEDSDGDTDDADEPSTDEADSDTEVDATPAGDESDAERP